MAQQLVIKTITEVKGKLRVPSFQRGYRWEPRQVYQLLDDLKEHVAKHQEGEPYYLQPVVVAPANIKELEDLDEENRFDFDLIDGQQRLTTIYIIFKAIEKLKGYDRANLNRMESDGEIDVKQYDELYNLYNQVSKIDSQLYYELQYQTRTLTRGFLNNIATKKEGDADVISSPDHLYIFHAFDAVLRWIQRSGNDEKIREIARRLKTDVKIIWYELAQSIESWKKFTDLNAGKIELTNSELVKAILLNRSNQTIKDYEQDIVVSQWDRIENDLNDIEFWNFLTKKPQSDYPVKIDLIFDLVAGKTGKNKKDTYFTFNKLQQLLKSDSTLTGKQQWDKIYSRYLRLRDWYNDPWYYHRIGYLVATGDDNALLNIFNAAYPEGVEEGVGKKKFREIIKQKVKESMVLPDGIEDYTKLRFDDKKVCYPFLKKLLTLYNVMLCDKLSKHKVRYPFFKHNSTDAGGWTLEHIHAQNSEGLTTAKQWKEWVADHLKSLKRLRANPIEEMKNFDSKRADALIKRMGEFQDNANIKNFTDIANEYEALTAIKGMPSGEEMHLLSNLALLSREDNSGLNKSTFDVKRIKIANRVSTNYVPIGTERVFMKSIAGSSRDEHDKPIPGTDYACDGGQMFYWGEKDRKAYLRDIEETLKDYITFKKEAEPEVSIDLKPTENAATKDNSIQ